MSPNPFLSIRMLELPCPCKSGASYPSCCQPYHEGKFPETALKLMRSRYSAYALNLPEYIIKTTHPDHPDCKTNKELWKKNISSFSRHSQFEHLEILEFQEKDSEAIVLFRATIKDQRGDVSFTEKSFFEKIKKQWLYRSGEILT